MALQWWPGGGVVVPSVCESVGVCACESVCGECSAVAAEKQ